LRAAALWRAELGSDAYLKYAYWDLVDLRRMQVVPMENIEAQIGRAVAAIPDIEAQIGEAVAGIPIERRRKEAFERLTLGLKAADRPSRPDLSEKWRSTPNVLFEPGDPAPEPFDWGPPKWTSVRGYAVEDFTEEWPFLEDYEEDLAAYLGTLACSGRHDDLMSQARVQWVARRVINGLMSRSSDGRLAARLIAHDCTPAKALPEATRRSLAVIAR
jgi:hypothetical protein